MKSFVLSSGSSANCFFARSLGGINVLIDCGLSFSKTSEFLGEKGVKLEDIDAVFITHEHSDHIVGLKKLFKSLNCDFYFSKGTFDALNYKELFKSDRIKFVKNHDVVVLNDLKIFVVDKPHDSKEAISYVLDDSINKIGYFTDLGYINSEIKFLMKECDVLYIETNYCEDILNQKKGEFYGNYVSRLVSNVGHLSLQEAILNLKDIIFDGQKLILSHISENTNLYVNSYEKVKNMLSKSNKNVDLIVSFQNESSDWIE